MSTVIPNAFARRVMENALGEMKERLAQIQPLIAEAAGLEKAIAAQEAALKKVPATNGQAQALPPAAPPHDGGATPRALPGGPAVTPAPAGRDSRAADAELGTIKQQIYKLLRHPEARRGVAAAVLARAVRGAQTSSVMAQLSTYANDPDEGIERVGKGFYRLALGWTVDDDGNAQPPAG